LTCQAVSDGLEQVHAFQSEENVLPAALDGQARLVVGPRQIVVVTAIEHCVRRLRGRDAWHQLLVQYVAIVTDAHLKLHRCVNLADHRRVEEGRVQPELATPQKILTIGKKTTSTLSDSGIK